MSDPEPYVKLIVDWTEDGHGIVLDTTTEPATVVGTHDMPDLEAEIERLTAELESYRRAARREHAADRASDRY